MRCIKCQQKMIPSGSERREYGPLFVCDNRECGKYGVIASVGLPEVKILDEVFSGEQEFYREFHEAKQEVLKYLENHIPYTFPELREKLVDPGNRVGQIILELMAGLYLYAKHHVECKLRESRKEKV
jgi:hypothetical protein